ncbi:MAG: ATP-binding protein [Deltaproteobacteria bacterium]|nr:ATP-binding protein [Deltaproteobacteria bacterium]
MKNRSFWIGKISEAFKKRSIIWLAGVRRAGKTVLCRSLPDVSYYDCELPSTRRMLEAPESFLKGAPDRLVVLDEVHRLSNPSELLKIAADHFSTTRIIATGSSTLGASAKFRDTLAGRKTQIWLTPMLMQDMVDFGVPDMDRRFLHGGLPPFFLDNVPVEAEFQEWLDGYWAKDIQELFRLERRHSFQRFLELLLINSGGIFEATKYARPCEISRTTVANYLAVLENTFVVQVLRPFNTYKPAEIVAAPKVYGFDTGFVCCFRGWNSLRPDDRGPLWEHVVLNELQGRLQNREIGYWRDKRGKEVDFIIARRDDGPVAIECKWQADGFSADGIRAFRKFYPQGRSFVVASDVQHAYTRQYGDQEICFTGLDELIQLLGGT